jgi:hypothetical protein
MCLPKLGGPLLIFVLAACSATPFPRTDLESSVPLTLLPASMAGVEDKRARFRDIFCAVLESHGRALPDYRSCEKALTRVGVEPESKSRTVDLGRSQRRLAAVVIPGVGWDCFAQWLDTHHTIEQHLSGFGYSVSTLKVDGLSSSTRNAKYIRDALVEKFEADSQQKLVLIGYSKGANDILEALVAYPELRPYVAAVVSAAGAIGGSPLAEDASEAHLSLITEWPGAECTSGDAGAIESLRPSVRQAWLWGHSLPRDFPYYSLVSLPEEARISNALLPSHDRLSLVDSRNDGQLLFYDQIIPGSSLLGYLNADHWSVAAPIGRTHEFIGSTIADQNDFPREALFEAILRFVEEDLNAAESTDGVK